MLEGKRKRKMGGYVRAKYYNRNGWGTSTG